MVFLAGTDNVIQLNGSIFVVAILLVVYHLVMSRLFYRPFFRVLNERERQTTGKLELAARSEEESRYLLERWENGVRGARQEGLAGMEKARLEALQRQTQLLTPLQAEVQNSLKQSRDEIRQATSAARRQLESEIAGIARSMAGAILHREPRLKL